MLLEEEVYEDVQNELHLMEGTSNEIVVIMIDVEAREIFGVLPLVSITHAGALYVKGS